MFAWDLDSHWALKTPTSLAREHVSPWLVRGRGARPMQATSTRSQKPQSHNIAVLQPTSSENAPSGTMRICHMSKTWNQGILGWVTLSTSINHSIWQLIFPLLKSTCTQPALAAKHLQKGVIAIKCMLMRSHKQTHLTCVIYREREWWGREWERLIWSYLIIFVLHRYGGPSSAKVVIDMPYANSQTHITETLDISLCLRTLRTSRSNHFNMTFILTSRSSYSVLLIYIILHLYCIEYIICYSLMATVEQWMYPGCQGTIKTRLSRCCWSVP